MRNAKRVRSVAEKGFMAAFLRISVGLSDGSRQRRGKESYPAAEKGNRRQGALMRESEGKKRNLRLKFGCLGPGVTKGKKRAVFS
jgi:hypothetical protein